MLLFSRWLTAARRLVGAWAVCQAQPEDVVWPGLRDYPYGPPPH
jgi:hypothetical protein